MKLQTTLLLLLLATSLLLVSTAPPPPPPPRRRLRSPPPPSPPTHPPPPPPPSLGCTTQVLGFSVCLPYISDPPNNLTNLPSPLCCNAYESTFRAGEANCLCYLARQALMFGFPINTTKMYSLSSFCPLTERGSQGLGTLQSICSVSAALPPLRSTPGSGFSAPHNLDIGSLPPISSSLPKPDADLAPPKFADQAPSKSNAAVITYNASSSTTEQLSKNHIWIKSLTLIIAVSMICYL